jgi:hypothetical protein
VLRGPSLRRASLVLLTILVAAASPAVAIAASNTGTVGLPGSTSPFSPGLPQGATTTTTSSTTASSTSSSTNNGLSGAGIAAIAAGALLLIGGISFYIWWDARRKAPVRPGTDPYAIDGGRRAGSKAKPKARKLSAAERKRRKRGRAR